MLKLEDIKKDAAISGIVPSEVVSVVTGDHALTVYYRTLSSQLSERMLFYSNEPNLAIAEAGWPWAFDMPGAEFKAYRIRLAHLFDPMMAVHTSNVEPVPYQILA